MDGYSKQKKISQLTQASNKDLNLIACKCTIHLTLSSKENSKPLANFKYFKVTSKQQNCLPVTLIAYSINPKEFSS